MVTKSWTMAIAHNSCRTLHNSHQRRCVTKRRYSAESIGPSHTHPFNGPLSRTTRVSRYQKGNTNLDFTETRDSEWQWHQLDHMQVCTSLQTDNHASTPPLSFLQAACPSCRPTNSVKAQAELNKLLVRGNQRHCISDRNTTTSDITYIPRDDLLLGNWCKVIVVCVQLHFQVKSETVIITHDTYPTAKQYMQMYYYYYDHCLQCFGAVGWATKRATSL